MNEQILNRVREIAGDVLDAQVNADSSPLTIGTWDSVRHIDLMMALEAEYAIRFRPAEIDEARSIGQIAGLIASKRA
jgi:acyl carrier protein